MHILQQQVEFSQFFSNEQLITKFAIKNDQSYRVAKIHRMP